MVFFVSCPRRRSLLCCNRRQRAEEEGKIERRDNYCIVYLYIQYVIVTPLVGEGRTLGLIREIHIGLEQR